MKKSKIAGRWSLFVKNAGLPPGALVERNGSTPDPELEIYRYGTDSQKQEKIAKGDIASLGTSGTDVLWINVVGNGDADVLRLLESRFDLSSLTLERIQNGGQRPGIYDFGHYLHVIVKMVTWDSPGNAIATEQVSLILGQGYVISIQERAGDLFDPVRERIAKGRGRVRGKGADYLFYALIDSVVDNLFLLCDTLQEQEEILEDIAMYESSSDTFQKINHLKSQLILMRRAVWPLRELLTAIQKDEFQLISGDNLKYFRDVLDHDLIIVDMIEHSREVLNSLYESKITNISVEMNNVMKVLTIIATIFIPLTFVAGIYGMNFSYMPELIWRWGYFAVLGFMAVIFIAMLIFFKHKKWL